MTSTAPKKFSIDFFDQLWVLAGFVMIISIRWNKRGGHPRRRSDSMHPNVSQWSFFQLHGHFFTQVGEKSSKKEFWWIKVRASTDPKSFSMDFHDMLWILARFLRIISISRNNWGDLTTLWKDSTDPNVSWWPFFGFDDHFWGKMHQNWSLSKSLTWLQPLPKNFL